MKKRMASFLTCLAVIVAMLPVAAMLPEAVSAAPFVMPSHNGKTNNVSFTLGAGTDAEVPVYADFRPSLSTKAFDLKYIMIHNTGTYVGTGTAKNVHTNTNKTSSSACWHYTVDNTSIYQGVPDTTYAFHAGTSRTTTPSSYNALGIEMCVNYFPATETFGGEKWNDGTAIMKWYEERFDQTMKNTAYLVAVLCARHGLDYRTAVKMHYDALQYDPATNKGKDCPMQMRARYNEATNSFTAAGYYTTARDGYFWQIFWSYLEQYAAGAKEVDSPLDPKHTITFESNGGSAVSPVKVKDGETAVAPAAPSRYGFNFAGWYCNPELTDPYDFGTPVPYDFTLYAKWEEAYWGAQTNLMPNEQQLKLNDFSGQGQIWPYFNNDSYGSVTMYNGVTNDANWSWPTAYMEYENSFDCVNDTYLYVKKDGTAQFNVMLTYLDKDGVSHNALLSDVAVNGGDFAAGYMERFINIGSYIRNIGHAPASGNVKFTKVTYYVVGQKEEYVKLYDLKFTTKFDIPDPYMTLMNSNVAQLAGAGNYTYNNGTLSMTANDAGGYSLKMDVNAAFNPTEMSRLLMDVNATAPFNVELELTNANGDATVSLKNEYFDVFGLEGEFTALPAGNWNKVLNLLGYYDWNGGAVTNSTIKSVKLSLEGQGTLTLNALQVSRMDTINYVKDGQSSNGSFDNSSIGDVNGDAKMDSTDVRMLMFEVAAENLLNGTQKVLADYNRDGKVNTNDARLMLLGITA